MIYVVLLAEFCIQSAFGPGAIFIWIVVPFESGALMITRRTLEGAWKCDLRLFLRLELSEVLIFVIVLVRDEGGGAVCCC